ncbi:MAG: hypothetical protein R6U19_08110 [Bacteroidales bacterium]
MKCKYTIYIMLFLFFLPAITHAGEKEQRTFSHKKLQTIKNDRKHAYYIELEAPDNRMEILLARLKSIFGENIDIKTLNTIFKTIPYLFIIAAVVLLLLKAGGYEASLPIKKQNKKQYGYIYNYQNTNETPSKDLEVLQNKAIRDGQFRLAVRFAFLRILKIMEKQGYITRKPYKSNYEYEKELEGKTFYREYLNISRIYEYTWYGNFSLQEHNYKNVLRQAENLISQIQNSKA